MDVKAIKPIDGMVKSAAISKYSSDRQGGESGRRQKSSDSYKPKPEKKEPYGLDKFFAGTAKRPNNELSEFELLLKKMWEDNNRMQESAKALEATAAAAETSIENTWVWGMYSGYRPVINK